MMRKQLSRATLLLLAALCLAARLPAPAESADYPDSISAADTPIPEGTDDIYRLVNCWGHLGDDEGEFLNPYGLDIEESDGDIYIYVADRDNHRIQKFDSEGNFMLMWGWFGPLPGQMRHPSGIAVSPLGTVYVSDRDNFRIQEFTRDGDFVAEWGEEPRAIPEYSCSTCAKTSECTAALGRGWACIDGCCQSVSADTEDNQTGEPINFEYPENTDMQFGELLFPEHLSIDRDGILYVSDSARVQRVAPSFTPLESDFEGVFFYNLGTGAFRGACDNSNDRKDSYWVATQVGADTYNRVFKFDFNGLLLLRLGGSGTPTDAVPSDDPLSTGKADSPYVAVGPEGNVFVSDTPKSRIQKFSGQGEFVTMWGGEDGSLSSPRQIVVDSAGTVYVLDGNTVKVFKTSGQAISCGDEGDGSSGTCSFVLNPTSETFRALGGVGQVRISTSDTDCAWTAETGELWITVTQGQTGTGNGLVSYTVSPNASYEDRIGRIDIAGFNFTVEQTGLFSGLGPRAAKRVQPGFITSDQ